MINVIFIDEDNTSSRNGIGTFRNKFVSEIIKHDEINLYLVSLNSKAHEIEFISTDNYYEVRFPFLNAGNWNPIGFIICPLLRQYIKDSYNNVFIINISPCSTFEKALRDLFPLSKIVFIVHDQGWCSSLYGDVGYLSDVIFNRPNKIIDDDMRRDITNYFEEEKNIYMLSDAIVAVSSSTAEILDTIYEVPKEKIVFIPHGLDIDDTRRVVGSKQDLRQKRGIQPTDIIIIYAGRTSRYKGLMPLLKALFILKQRHYEVKCVMCCSFSGLDEFGSLISPIASSLIFTGHISYEELKEWYQLADIGILPSYSEQFGFSALEMVLNHLPVVVSDGNGLKDLFVNNETAIVANIGDVLNIDEFAIQLANKIQYLIESSCEVVEKIKTSAIENAIKKYSLVKMINEYITLFKRLVGR